MRLTKIEALRLTAELWEWLAGNGRREKEAWPQWKLFPLPIHGFCFLCEYDSQRENRERYCYFCPLKGKWGTADYGPGSICLAQGSPYRVWEDAQCGGDFERAAEAAAQVAQLCQQELARLTKGKGR